jgi:hypothetical protein
MPQQNELTVLLGPLALYFVRLPDDEYELTKVIVGVMLRGVHTRFLRCAMEPDQWDKWKLHPHFERPVAIMVRAKREAPGVTLRIAAMVPLADLPREQWGPQFEGEEWRGNSGQPPNDALGALELGVLVRYEAKCHHADLSAEMLCMIRKAIEGDLVEPYEQGLSS